MHIYVDQSDDSGVYFLNRLEQAAPMKIVKLLTDKGNQQEARTHRTPQI